LSEAESTISCGNAHIQQLNDSNLDSTIAAIKQTVDDLKAIGFSKPANHPLRRASSCSDLNSQQKKLISKGSKQNYGFVTKVGITIPKTPDTMKRYVKMKELT